MKLVVTAAGLALVIGCSPIPEEKPATVTHAGLQIATHGRMQPMPKAQKLTKPHDDPSKK